MIFPMARRYARCPRAASPIIDANESFFALLQKNVLNTRVWQTRQELRLEIVSWIEAVYHRRRRQRSLGRLTPIEYEMIITKPAATAA
jgi:putative transposase